MKNVIDLYQSKDFETLVLNDREEWLKARKQTIGGSEASSLIGMNKYQSIRDLWMIKKGLKKNDVSGALIDYGNAMEPILRRMFEIKHPEIMVQYKENAILYSKKYKHASYSPDGLLFNGTSRGILECKTSFIRQSSMYQEWNGRVPNNYYIQVLHGFIVTGYEFIDLIAELRFLDGNSQIREYHIEKNEVLDDIKFIKEKEKENWDKYFIENQEPPITLNL